jgi:hypothetical protein
VLVPPQLWKWYFFLPSPYNYRDGLTFKGTGSTLCCGDSCIMLVFKK